MTHHLFQTITLVFSKYTTEKNRDAFCSGLTLQICIDVKTIVIKCKCKMSIILSVRLTRMQKSSRVTVNKGTNECLIIGASLAHMGGWKRHQQSLLSWIPFRRNANASVSVSALIKPVEKKRVLSKVFPINYLVCRHVYDPVPPRLRCCHVEHAPWGMTAFL